MLNVFGFLASIIYGSKVFRSISIYLVISLACEVFYELIINDFVLIFGVKTNAPFGHLYNWTQFIAFSYFFFEQQKVKKMRLIFFSFFSVFFLLSICPYIFLGTNLMHFDPYVAMITMICVLIFCFIYFIQILNDREGFPFIGIGIFLVTGSSLINYCVIPLWEGVNLEIIHFRNIINLFPFIIMQLLFAYECYLFFKSRRRNLSKLKSTR